MFNTQFLKLSQKSKSNLQQRQEKRFLPSIFLVKTFSLSICLFPPSRWALWSVSQLQAGQGPVPSLSSSAEEDAGGPETADAAG